MSDTEDKGCEDKSLVSRGANYRSITFFGEITEKSAFDLCNCLLDLDEINNEDITLYINSSGGDAIYGLAIYDTMQYINSDVRVVALGEICSMASVILAAGTKGKRSCLPSTRIMMHEMSYTADGDKFKDYKATFEENQALQNKLTELLAKHTTQSARKIAKDIQKDFWMGAKEALDYGLIDKILTKAPKIKLSKKKSKG